MCIHISTSPYNFRFRPNDATRLPIDDSELFLHDRLQSSHSTIDELISHGSAILEQIRSQGIGLKGIKRKVLDIGQTVHDFLYEISHNLERIHK